MAFLLVHSSDGGNSMLAIESIDKASVGELLSETWRD